MKTIRCYVSTSIKLQSVAFRFDLGWDANRLFNFNIIYTSAKIKAVVSSQHPLENYHGNVRPWSWKCYIWVNKIKFSQQGCNLIIYKLDNMLTRLGCKGTISPLIYISDFLYLIKSFKVFRKRLIVQINIFVIDRIFF